MCRDKWECNDTPLLHRTYHFTTYSSTFVWACWHFDELNKCLHLLDRYPTLQFSPGCEQWWDKYFRDLMLDIIIHYSQICMYLWCRRLDFLFLTKNMLLSSGAFFIIGLNTMPMTWHVTRDTKYLHNVINSINASCFMMMMMMLRHPNNECLVTSRYLFT